jgi:glutathione S-transferase
MHSGFASLRSALPMNIKAHFPNFPIWARAQTDIERITTIWLECLRQYDGPYLFGTLSAADAMFAPVVTRFVTYDVKLEPEIVAYSQRILALPEMQQWIADAQQEVEEIDELDAEF